MAKNTKADPIKDTAPYLVQVVARLQTTAFCNLIEGSGVHPAESYVLLELWREEPLSQTQISQRLDIGNATVGQTLKRLENNGFVTRKPCLDDRRRLLVHLTEKGRNLQTRLTESSNKLNDELEKVIGKQKNKALGETLNELAVYLRQKLADK